MYTEIQLQEAIQTTILTVDSYSSGDVVINDWTVYDQQTMKSPYVIIGNCPNPTINYRDDINSWTFPLVLAVAFQKTWKETEDAIRTYRQELITLFRTDPYQQLGLSTADEGLEIRLLEAQTDFLPWYDPSLTDDEKPEATPLFMFQELNLYVENY